MIFLSIVLTYNERNLDTLKSILMNIINIVIEIKEVTI
jgi:hypothetical protein